MSTKERLIPGTRVYHYGEQYVAAQWDGTATVMGVERECSDGSCEYLIRRDKPLLEGMSIDTTWPSYYTNKAASQPEPTLYACRGCTEEFNELQHPPIFDEGELRYAPRGYELSKYHLLEEL